MEYWLVTDKLELTRPPRTAPHARQKEAALRHCPGQCTVRTARCRGVRSMLYVCYVLLTYASIHQAMQITIPEQVLFREVGNEGVILSLEDGHYFGLDETGTRIWKLLQSDQDLDAITECIVSEYDVSADRAKADIDRFIQELLSAKLITIAQGTR